MTARPTCNLCGSRVLAIHHSSKIIDLNYAFGRLQ